MNKNQVATAAAARSGESIEAAKRVINAALQIMSEALQRGENVTLTNFGSLTPYERAAFQGTHPRHGHSIDVPGRRSVRFKASKKLKADMNKESE